MVVTAGERSATEASESAKCPIMHRTGSLSPTQQRMIRAQMPIVLELGNPALGFLFSGRKKVKI